MFSEFMRCFFLVLLVLSGWFCRLLAVRFLLACLIADMTRTRSSRCLRSRFGQAEDPPQFGGGKLEAPSVPGEEPRPKEEAPEGEVKRQSKDCAG